MKSVNHSKANNINYHRAIFALVLLLSLLPVAQAFHFSEHENLNNEYNCLVCHGYNNIEDGAHSSEFYRVVSFQPITFIKNIQGPFKTFTTNHPDNIRAPPSV